MEILFNYLISMPLQVFVNGPLGAFWGVDS